jgi:hypothetical protein
VQTTQRYFLQHDGRLLGIGNRGADQIGHFRPRRRPKKSESFAKVHRRAL